MPADNLKLVNQSNTGLVIQSQTIAAGTSYTVPFGNLAAFATDPFLRAYILSGQIYLSVLGVNLYEKNASDWLDAMFRGSIVYAS